MQPNQLDQDAVNLAKAIRQTESGDNFQAQGKSGEYGAYQFTEPTWNAWSKKHGVNVPLAQSTREQQNEVAYKQIKEWKDQGLNPGQISSMWNSGKPDAYLDPNYKGTNSSGAQFDVPAYTNKVTSTYHALKGQAPTAVKSGAQTLQAIPINSYASVPSPAPEYGEKGFLKEAGEDIGGAFKGAGEAFGKDINLASKALQSTGALAGGFNKLVGTGLEHTPVIGGAVKKLEKVVGKGAEKALGTGTGQKALQWWQEYSQEHPEAAGNIGAAGNIAMTIPILKGLSAVKGAIKGGVNTALRGSTDSVAEMVSPKLTAKSAEEAIKAGTTRKGLLRVETPNVPARIQSIADTVKEAVPKFKPQKGLLYNIDTVRKAESKIATDLIKKVEAGGKDMIYSPNELKSVLNKIETPISIRGTAFEKQLKPLKEAVHQIAQKNGGKVSSLLKTRKEFDALVNEQYPNLWTAEYAPMRKAVQGVRDALTDYTAARLPADVGLKASYKVQTRLMRAIDNMTEKAASGAQKEIGTSWPSRFGARHPLLRGIGKTAVQYGVAGTGAGAVINLMNK